MTPILRTGRGAQMSPVLSVQVWAWSLTGHQRPPAVKHQDGSCMLQAGARSVTVQCVIHLAGGAGA